MLISPFTKRRSNGRALADPFHFRLSLGVNVIIESVFTRSVMTETLPKVSIYLFGAVRLKLTAYFGEKLHSPSCCLLSWRRRRGLLRGVTSDAESRTYGATKRRGSGTLTCRRQLHNMLVFNKLYTPLESSNIHVTIQLRSTASPTLAQHVVRESVAN